MPKPCYFTFETTNGQKQEININNLSEVLLVTSEKNKNEYNIEFRFKGGKADALTYTVNKNEYDEGKQCIDEIIEICKTNKINIFVRRVIEGVRNSDKHIIIFFVDNNAYIGNGKIRDLDNRSWSIRNTDTIDYYFNEEDADCDDRVKNSLDEFYNKMKTEIEGYKNLIKLTEEKYINIITSILSKDNTKEAASVERILTEEALIIPDAETIKETLTENRQTFLYRSKH